MPTNSRCLLVVLQVAWSLSHRESKLSYRKNQLELTRRHPGNCLNNFSRLLCGFVGLIPTAIEGTYGRSWLACIVGGICRSGFGETSTSPAFLVKERVQLVLFPL